MSSGVKICGCNVVHLCENCVSYRKLVQLDTYLGHLAYEQETPYKPLIRMPLRKFFDLTENWSNNFYSYYQFTVISEQARVDIRDQMREGHYLIIWANGKNVPVEFQSEGISMSNEIQPTRKAIEGEVITEKTPEQAGRELGEAWNKLKQTVTDLSKGFKQVSGKPPIVVEGIVFCDFSNNNPIDVDPGNNGKTLGDYLQDLLDNPGGMDRATGKRVRVTIEVLED